MGETTRPTPAQVERRIRILETAMRMAGDGGYEAVQMRAVAEQSGVALGTIYRYYSGKDELLIAGLAGWLRRTRRRVESAVLQGDSPGERLIWLLRRSAERTQQRPTLMGALITALGPDSGHDAEGIARVIGHVWSSALTRWVSGMAPDGSVEIELVHAAEMLAGVPSRI